MHLYFIGRGVSKYLRRMEEDIQHHQVQWPNGDYLHLGMREVKLYELAFPKEAVNQVVALLGNDQKIGKWNKFRTLLRKVLGLKPIPKKDPNQPALGRPNTGIHLIGIKEDRDNLDGTEHI